MRSVVRIYLGPPSSEALGSAPRAKRVRGCSSVGRAPVLQAGGRGFDPLQLHPSTRWGTIQGRGNPNGFAIDESVFLRGRRPFREAPSGCFTNREKWTPARPGGSTVALPDAVFENCILGSFSKSRVLKRGSSTQCWSSYEGHTVDALAREGDEGRGKLR